MLGYVPFRNMPQHPRDWLQHSYTPSSGHARAHYWSLQKRDATLTWEIYNVISLMMILTTVKTSFFSRIHDQCVKTLWIPRGCLLKQSHVEDAVCVLWSEFDCCRKAVKALLNQPWEQVKLIVSNRFTSLMERSVFIIKNNRLLSSNKRTATETRFKKPRNSVCLKTPRN